MMRFSMMLVWLVTMSCVLAPDVRAEDHADLSTLTRTVLGAEAVEGKVVYLDFWASWCAPCKKSFPWMESMYQKYAQQGLVIVAVNLDEDPQQAQKFLRKASPSFMVTSEHGTELAEAFELKAMPTSFLFDRSGELVMRHEGFENRQREELESAMAKALNPPDGNDRAAHSK